MSTKEENEEKKKYLSGYLKAVQEEGRITEEIELLKSRKKNPFLQMDGMPKGNGHSDLSVYAAELDRLERKLEAEKIKTVQRYEEIREQVNLVSDEPYRTLLTKRYLLGKVWEQIAVDMELSYRHILRMHGEALRQFKIPEKIF